MPLLGAGNSRIPPEYDFTVPPHPGKLHYEKFDWGVDGDRWRALASVALERLQISGPI
jgi:hypothetical protein